MESNIHKEIMLDLNMNRKEYLSALRKWQPLSELKRKAKKSARLKQKLRTQEDIDLICAESICNFILLEHQ